MEREGRNDHLYSPNFGVHFTPGSEKRKLGVMRLMLFSRYFEGIEKSRICCNTPIIKEQLISKQQKTVISNVNNKFNLKEQGS